MASERVAPQDRPEDEKMCRSVPFQASAFLELGDRKVRATTKAISLRAVNLSVELQEQIPARKRIYLTVLLHDVGRPNELNLTGTMVRQDRDGVVVEFDSVEFDTFMRLKSIVSFAAEDEDRIRAEFVSEVVHGGWIP